MFHANFGLELGKAGVIAVYLCVVKIYVFFKRATKILFIPKRHKFIDIAALRCVKTLFDFIERLTEDFIANQE